MRQRQDVGAFGHEVDAAEHDVVGARMVGDGAGELERIAGVVREPDHFIPLIVMAENDEALAKGRARRGNAQRHLIIRQPEVRLWQRLALVD